MMADLQDLDGGAWRLPVTFDSASAVSRASTLRKEATITIAWLFGSSPGGPGPSGHRILR